ncbi:MAG: GTP 3',8-cyclase 1 [Fimbriimonadaceae bacterium]|nr:GTP 3',8-cyclase 1 [Fimbriimonadaceae bacterium]
MPAEGLNWLPRMEVLSFEEIERLTRLFVSLGVDKIRLTGGEPTVRKDLELLIDRLAGIDGVRSFLMTTNGSTLATKAGSYRQAGLTGLNISIDSLKPDRFKEITLRDELYRVLRGIDAAIEAGYESVKLNIVVMAGINDDELLDLVEFARHRPVVVRFIEFMPFEGNGWQQASVFTYRQMRSIIESRYDLVPLATEASAVGKDFGIDGFAGTIGFVTSMTESFCDGCNRLRLTAEGAFKACLFAGSETSLRDPMRQGADDQALEGIVREALSRKWRGHPPMDLLPQVKNRSMVAIGG